MKNKEIEEILEGIKVVIQHNGTLEFDVKELKILLSYIEQLEADCEDANESITWWTNRFSAVERDNRNLKNNRDKAIEYVKEKTTDDEGNDLGYSDNIDYEILLNILKGDSNNE